MELLRKSWVLNNPMPDFEPNNALTWVVNIKVTRLKVNECMRSSIRKKDKEESSGRSSVVLNPKDKMGRQKGINRKSFIKTTINFRAAQGRGLRGGPSKGAHCVRKRGSKRTKSISPAGGGVDCSVYHLGRKGRIPLALASNL
jgi:hypothetical protein